MKKFSLILILAISAQLCFGQHIVEINKWMLSNPQKMNMPAFAEVKNVDGKTFNEADLLDHIQIDLNSKALIWKTIELNDDDLALNGVHENELVAAKSYISVNRWTTGSLNLSVNALCEVYLDGQMIKAKKNADFESLKIDLELNRGNHEIAIKAICGGSELKLKTAFEYSDDFKDCMAQSSLNPERFFNIHDVLEGKSVASAKISPSGKYVLISHAEVMNGSGKTKRYSELINLETKTNVTLLRNEDISNLAWLPQTDRLSYTLNFDGKSELFVYDLKSFTETSIAKDIKSISGITWSPTEDFIIFSVYVEAEKPGDLKRVFGSDDRLPYFRGRSFLHKIDVKTGNITQLTAGNQTASLHDIKSDGSKILFSVSRMDYTEVPFSKQTLYEMNMKTMELNTVWTDKLYDGYCTYSPDGSKLLVQGSPETFGELGVNVSEGRIPNSYDGQLYLFDLNTKKVEAITKYFDPSVNSAYWIQENEIYLSVGERDYVKLYKYNLKSKKFENIPLQVDVLNNIDFARDKAQAVYTGTSISTPQKLFELDLNKATSSLLLFPEKERFAQIKFGKTEDWNFVNKNGTTIYGRIYYPPDYDASKTYPLIVNYYGGTSPVERSFGGRYPLNNWAANGYIVYLLEPSGATGFGQDFSALHVNGWGFDAIDDIIDGTKQFLKAHPTADAANVGCIGASYGGYTTMLLQTRTDIFKTAISHAGISSITSYWGEGYWGYSYSSGATKNSYPWNRKDIYVENSPLYNADKFQNSILLLHGTSDTNVPLGESLQFYTALNLLGKDVEMVLVDGQNHHILDYEKRIKWHYTIISWFDKKLKDQLQQWNKLYPEKNL